MLTEEQEIALARVKRIRAGESPPDVYCDVLGVDYTIDDVTAWMSIDSGELIALALDSAERIAALEAERDEALRYFTYSKSRN